MLNLKDLQNMFERMVKNLLLLAEDIHLAAGCIFVSTPI